MRRVTTFLRFVAIALALFGLAMPFSVTAQEATPAAEAMMEGVTFDPIAYAVGVEIASPADLSVFRVGFSPGGGFTFNEGDPTGGILVVESGEVTIRVGVPWVVMRAGSLQDAMADAEATGAFMPAIEEVAADQEVTLLAGDAGYIPGGVPGEMRNDGEEPAIALGFLAGPSQAMMAEATPAP